jgi:hypothetical protein
VKNRRISPILATVATALAFLPTTVLADPITQPVDVQGMGLHDDVRITYSPAGLWNDEVSAGQILVGYKGQDYAAYCVDIFQYADGGPVTETSPVGLPHGDLAAWLFETYAPTVTTDAQAAALQVAIWEVLYEDPQSGYDVQHGTFRMTGAGEAKQLAQGLLDALPASHTPAAGTIILASDSHKDLMISSGSAPVPEAGTMALLALGGTTMILRRRCACR